MGFNVFFVGFRYKIGPDYLQYELGHEKILQNNVVFTDKLEFFHIQITKFSNEIGANFQFVLLVYAPLLFFYKGFQYFSLKTKVFDALVIMFFFAFMFFPLMNGLRQALVVAMFIYASRYILEKKMIHYLLIITLSLFIHKSAIILFPMYSLLRFKIDVKLFVFYFLIIVLLIFLNPFYYLTIIYNKFDLPYQEYLDYGKFYSAPDMFVIFITLLGLSSFFGLLILNRNDKFENFIFNAVLMSVLFKVSALHILVIGRLAYYFKPFIILFMAYFCYKVF